MPMPTISQVNSMTPEQLKRGTAINMVTATLAATAINPLLGLAVGIASLAGWKAADHLSKKIADSDSK
jgi:hypothetical protein